MGAKEERNMKIISVAGMRRRTCFQTVCHRAMTADLVVVAGELLDPTITDASAWEIELEWLAEWSQALRDIGPLAVALGFRDRGILDQAVSNGWIRPDWRSFFAPGTVLEGHNHLIEIGGRRAFVSVLPSALERIESWTHQWACGAMLAGYHGAPWVVVRGWAPGGTPSATWYDPWIGEETRIEPDLFSAAVHYYQPNLALVGYPGHAPFEGGHWQADLGRTKVLSPGVRQHDPYPCIIEIDLGMRWARWRVPGLPASAVSLEGALPASTRGAERTK